MSRGRSPVETIECTHKLVRDGSSQAKCLGNLTSRVNALSDSSEEHAGVVDVGDG